MDSYTNLEAPMEGMSSRQEGDNSLWASGSNRGICKLRQAMGRNTYLVSLSSCSSSCAILASRAAMVDLNLDLTAPSISCSLLRSSLFCRSSCCLALSFFWAALRSVASSLLSCSACGGWGRS